MAIDSAAWPCEYVAAKTVKLRVTTALPPPPPPPPSNVLVAQPELRPNEIQDFAEQLPDIRKAVGPLELRFHVRLELDGRGKAPTEEVVNKLNLLLAKITKLLYLK